MPRTKKQITFAKGFKHATPDEIRQAIGESHNEKCYHFEMKRPSSSHHDDDDKSLDTSNPPFYHPVPNPTSIDDWLAQYVEDRDTFDEWKTLRKKIARNSFHLQQNIGLLWVEKEEDSGSVNNRKHYLQHLKRFVEAFYFGINVSILDTVQIQEDKKGHYVKLASSEEEEKKSNSSSVHRIKSRRCHEYDEDKAGEDEIQFKASDLIVPLHKLRKQIQDSVSCVCGVTMDDLFSGTTDSFTCGLAQGGDYIGVFSMCRYDPLFRKNKQQKSKNKKEKVITVKWEEDDGVISEDTLTENDLIILERCCKIVVHEIAHMVQVGHCVYFDCIMNGSGHLEEDYRQSIHLCPVDLRKFQHLIGFDIVKRYRALLKFYQAYHMVEAANWTQDMIQYLTKKRRSSHEKDEEDEEEIITIDSTDDEDEDIDHEEIDDVIVSPNKKRK